MNHASPLVPGATEKQCSKCRETKPLTEFGVRNAANRRGYASWCKECERTRSRRRYMDPVVKRYHLEYGREWRAANRAKSNAYGYAWRARNFTQASISKRKDRYGLTAAEFYALLEKQEYRCAICGKGFDPEAGISAIHVDHDHDTDEVRGLLCGKCNRGIGMFEDNPFHLCAAADYLFSFTSGRDRVRAGQEWPESGP